MEGKNDSQATEFIFLGFTDCQELQVVLFITFLAVYIITLVTNIGMILLIQIDSRLHSPMYFLLSNLSFVDICYSTVIAPKMLMDFLAENKAISYSGCVLQLYFFAALCDTECFLLAAMAYDRYVAICNPLLYKVVMSKKVCIQLVVGSYFLGILDSLIHTYFTFRLSFCGSNILNHFFCDIPPLLTISCSETHLTELMLFTFFGSIEAVTILTILVSYVYIVRTILRIRSAEGRRKTFSTCASHMLAVTIFHGTLIFTYFRPSSSYSLDTDKIASLFYTVVIPMLNPLIYSLRNKEVKGALWRAINKKVFFH
ncbi:olfactory receptor 1019-like [Alligator sinensis]|uniref:Olfactory receptor n=1 Tax=Alligator sinensis TaxID=38654 RepID=A0A1U7SP34_ALLSI|nr:olfactory receptor 1019-like [Alligator sinensis]